jgi:SAM-dependent methyltransferase
MARFWDQRARENAYFFIDNRLAYRDTDPDRFWASGERDLDTLLKTLDVEIAADDEVLEIGCGVGRMTRPIAARAGDVIALDVSAEMLAQAREENPELDHVTWIHGDGTSLGEIGDASVDACVSHVVLQHIPDPSVILHYVTEMGRVLRPGGWAAFQVSNDERVHAPRRSRIRDRVRAFAGRAPKGQDHPAWRGSSVTVAGVREAAALGGMAVERVVGEGTQFCLVLARRRVGVSTGRPSAASAARTPSAQR